MKTWLVVIAVVLLNLAIVLVAMTPAVVTYAQLPSPGVGCSACSNPEVQTALARAAEVGRAQIQGLVISHSRWVSALALVNVSVVLVALYVRKRGAGDVV
jgi:hypothetical protein